MEDTPSVFIISIMGGSGSGKSTLAKRLLQELGPDNGIILAQDRYYRDNSKNFDGYGGSVNFDHPDTIELDLLAQHLGELKKNKIIEAPRYDFKTVSREEQKDTIKAHPIIILEGTLIFTQNKIIELTDYSILVDVPEETRFQRKVLRDEKERGINRASSKRQFETQVAPMHNKYIEPCKKKVTRVIGNSNEDFLLVLEEIKKALSS